MKPYYLRLLLSACSVFFTAELAAQLHYYTKKSYGLTAVRAFVHDATLSMRGQLYRRHHLGHYVMEGGGRRWCVGAIAYVTWISHECTPKDTGRWQWSAHTRVPTFSAVYRGHTIRHYTRVSRGPVDVKPCKQIVCNPRFGREIKLVRL